jgi:UDP-glucuronate 4-epimerase
VRILVTGAAGFIGYHVVDRLLGRGDEVVGLDSLNEYYDVAYKHARLRNHGISPDRLVPSRLERSASRSGYEFVKADLTDRQQLDSLFATRPFDRVCHLAAQAGVRYSLTNPRAYIDSNIVGFLNVLECCRHGKIGHLVYASSSSVYGLNETMPFSTSDSVDHPVSLYAATKKSNELMAHVYSHLFGLRTTGLRFFTVYGPWGRPDMALFIFTRAILEGRPIDVFNNGNMQRDFTYIDDIVEGVVRVIDRPPAGDPGWTGAAPDPASSRAPFRLYNIGNGSPVRLLDFIETIEECLGKKAAKNLMPMQAGDVAATWADVAALERDIGYRPRTPIGEGVKRFVEWYRDYHRV